VASEADGLVMITAAIAAVVTMQRLRRWWRALAVVTATSCGLGALLTMTRSVWVGAVLALLVVGVAHRPLRRLLPGLVAVIALAIAATLLAVPDLHDGVTERAETSRSLQDRQNTNAAALRIVEERPLTGVGWMRFIEESPEYVRQSDFYPITNIRIEVHNVFIGRAAELGLPGGLLWILCVLAGPVAVGLRRIRGDDELETWRLILLGTVTAWGVAAMSSPLPYPLPNLLLWLLTGIAMSTRLIRPTPLSGRTGDDARSLA
jgi:O-antigen ligase